METEHFYGIDKSIDISLLEYGVLVSNEPNDKKDHLIIYGINNNGDSYESFNVISLTEEELNSKINESWVNKVEFLSYCGQTEEEWLLNHMAGKMRDLLSYYGHENICGLSHGTMNEEEVRLYLSKYKK